MPAQEKLLAAARARIGRFVQQKKKRKTPEAPDWLQKHWVSGDKKAMCQLMLDVNFDKAFWQETDECTNGKCK